MNIMKLAGLAAAAGLLLLATPGDRAQAASIASPGIAAAVQQDAVGSAVTEVHWRRHHHHHGHRHHIRRHHHHYGHRHHMRRHHHHHYGRRW